MLSLSLAVLMLIILFGFTGSLRLRLTRRYHAVITTWGLRR